MSLLQNKRGWKYKSALCAVSVLAVVMLGMWIVSHLYFVQTWWPVSSTSTLMIDLLNGSVIVMYDPALAWHFVYAANGPRLTPFSLLDYSFRCGTLPGTSGWFFAFPAWLPFLLCAIWPSVVLYRAFHPRHQTGTCPACGYDLRGSKGSGACPECGEAIPEKAAGNRGA